MQAAALRSLAPRRAWLSTEAAPELPIILRTRKPPRTAARAKELQGAKLQDRREGRRTAVTEALDAAKALARAKFDEAVDMAVHLNVDAKRTDQRVRGMVTLPHGTGKKIVVAVFTKSEEQARLAREAGADLVGLEDLVARVKGGDIPFDRCLATADAMPALAQVARVLGPRGLMPNPKRGTVVKDVGPAVAEAKAGQIEFKADRHGIVHATIGRVSFPTEQLRANFDAAVEAVLAARPVAYRNKAPQSVALSTSMGRGSVPVDPTLL